jgi:hypothetical protein
LSYVWDIGPSGVASQPTAWRFLLADWQVASVITAMSGLPIDIVDSGAGSFYGLDGTAPLARPNFSAGSSCDAAMRDVPPGFFFNPFAFTRPTVQSGQPIPSSGGTAIASGLGTDIGNVGRNCLRGPRQTNVDLAVAKHFKFAAGRNLELRAEFFNLFNHANFANPISDLNAVTSTGALATSGQIVNPGDFGRIIATSNNPRLIQLVLKIIF